MIRISRVEQGWEYLFKPDWAFLGTMAVILFLMVLFWGPIVYYVWSWWNK